MLRIYSAEICPFAQRTRALLTHLDEPFELAEIDLDDRDADFLDLTPTGKVPLLVDDEVTLYESPVINEYLAESLEWNRAWPDTPALRARHRLAMKQWDEVVGPSFYEALRQNAGPDGPVGDEVEGELEELERTIGATGDDAVCLLGFHVAPFWARMNWLAQHVPLPRRIAARPGLRDWLDAAVAIPAVEETLPPREPTVRRYEEKFVSA